MQTILFHFSTIRRLIGRTLMQLPDLQVPQITEELAELLNYAIEMDWGHQVSEYIKD
jgi:hypothetical protein